MNEPPGETYHAAMRRVFQALRQLHENDVAPGHRLALGLSVKSIRSVMEGHSTSRSRLCPWSILSVIRVTDWSQKQSPPSARPATSPTPRWPGSGPRTDVSAPRSASTALSP